MHSPFGVVLHATLGKPNKNMEALKRKRSKEKGKKLRLNEAQNTTTKIILNIA